MGLKEKAGKIRKDSRNHVPECRPEQIYYDFYTPFQHALDLQIVRASSCGKKLALLKMTLLNLFKYSQFYGMKQTLKKTTNLEQQLSVRLPADSTWFRTTADQFFWAFPVEKDSDAVTVARDLEKIVMHSFQKHSEIAVHPHILTAIWPDQSTDTLALLGILK